MAQGLNQFKAAPASKRLMTALMGGAGLILLGGGGALMGLNSQLTGLQTVAQQKQQAVEGSESIAKRYLSTEEAYTETQSRMQCLEASVSPKSYVPTLLGQLQALAATTHLNVLAVRPVTSAPVAAPVPVRAASGEGTATAGSAPKAPPPPPYDTMEVAVDVTGTYADTAAFLYSLTRFPKIISVTGVQMHPSAQPDQTNPYAPPTVTTNLKLVAFMFHEDAPGASDHAGEAASQITPAAAHLTTAVPPAAVPPAAVPPAAPGTISGAVSRAAAGAVGATKAANQRGAVGVGTL